MRTKRKCFFVYFLSLLIILVCISRGGDSSLNAYWVDEPVWGAWVSPDWFFPGTQKYNEFDVRQTARRILQEMAQQGINNIFLETYLRGYSIAGVPNKSSGSYQPISEGVLPQGQLPVYRHLNWPYRIENGIPVDSLQIFIQEATPLGIKVHAWVHAFYWKMDNREIILPWHRGTTVWNGLLIEYLTGERKHFISQKNTPQKMISLFDDCIKLFSRTYDDFEFEKILDRYGVPHDNGKLLGSLIKYIVSQGGGKPDFVLMGTNNDPFPAAKNRRLGPIFLNPENPRVQETLFHVILSIARSHRGLAGIHLDHIRYAVDYQGFPEELQKPEWETLYFNPYNDDSMKLYRRYDEIITHRREVITSFVNRIADNLGKEMAVSAAVLPSNPPVPNKKVYFFSKCDFAAQDWYQWKVDFVVPMMYNYIPWRIRQKIAKWDRDLFQIYGNSVRVRIFPGVSHFQKAKLGLLDCDTWVFFDLTLARDLKFERKASDDFVVPPEN